MQKKICIYPQNIKELEFFYDESGSPYAFSYKASATASPVIYYYVTNLQGDVVSIIDSSGASKAEYVYNAQGEIISATGAMAGINPLRYRGYYYDTETGFYYCKSRYYDPELCRFISFDSTAITGQGFSGNNMFVYCGNNPVSRSDDEGEFWHIAVGAIVGAAVNVATSYTLNKIMGNDYSLANAAQDALTGALSGGLAASGVGVLGQKIANGFISAASTAYSTYKETGSVNTAKTVVSFAMGYLSGRYGGDGFASSKNIAKQIEIIGSNLHSALRSSSQNAIKRSLSYIANEANQVFRKFVVGSVFNNTLSVF